MDPLLAIAAAGAGAAYVLTPGPAFLALLGIGAAQGRRAGAGFLCGHLVGDTLWALLALLAIIGARVIGSLAFDVLGLVCGGYLCFLGAKAATARRDRDGGAALRVRRPLLRGLAFGLTNPKGYPVSVAMFTALLAGDAAALRWSSLPVLLAAAFVGFFVADVVLVAIVGTAGVRRFYRRYEIWIVRASGLLFIGFGLHAIANATTGLAHRRG